MRASFLFRVIARNDRHVHVQVFQGDEGSAARGDGGCAGNLVLDAWAYDELRDTFELIVENEAAGALMPAVSSGLARAVTFEEPA